MKQSTKKFILWLLEYELDQEHYNDFLEQKELDNYTKSLIDATVDFTNKYGEWHDKYFLKEKLEEYLGKEM